MKKLLLIALAFVTLQVSAQNDNTNSRKGDFKQRAERFKDYTPEEMAELQTKRLTLALDLTEAQQKQINALQLENAKVRKAKMESRQGTMRQGQKGLTKEERLAIKNERLDNQIAMKRKMKEILNKEQYDKWELIQKDKKNSFNKKRPNASKNCNNGPKK